MDKKYPLQSPQDILNRVVANVEAIDVLPLSDNLLFANNEEECKMWLIVEWKTASSSNTHSGYCLVSSDDLADGLTVSDFHTGKLVNVKTSSGIKPACIVIVSGDKPFLEMEIKHLQEAVQQISQSKRASAQHKNSKRQKTMNGNVSQTEEQSDDDFVESASDWNPDSDDNSEPEMHMSKTKSRSKRSSNQNSGANSSHKRKCSKGKRRHCTQKLKEEPLKEQNRNTVVMNVNQHLKRKPEPHNYQTPVNTNMQIRQYHTVQQAPITQPNNNVCFNVMPSQRQSFPTHNNTEFYKVPPMTFDQQTQTNISNSDPCLLQMQQDQKMMAEDIAYLHKVVEDMSHKINSLQSALGQADCSNYNESRISPSDRIIVNAGSYIVPEEHNGHTSLREYNESDANVTKDDGNNEDPYVFQTTSPVRGSAGNTPNPHTSQNTPLMHLPIHADGADMVPIGSGKTLIPRHIYNQIKWNSYSNATRKLLMAVFPRKTLATHSLTGKSSPAFNTKPAKMKLDAKKVTDIIITVSQMCNTPENLVRNVITTKCADENKMYRLRVEKMKNRRNNSENEENQSP